MGEIRKPESVKLVIGFLYNDPGVLDEAKKSLSLSFGKIDFESPCLDFSYTTYYSLEMGDGLKRLFISFEKLIDAESAYKTKLTTNALEKKLSRNEKRRINIDPGYIDMAKLVLFSTKDYAHRVSAGSGIFAEVTLFYKDGLYNPWPWTYPDYKSEEYSEIFNSIREIYRNRTVKCT
jgi:hypothetical protein